MADHMCLLLLGFENPSEINHENTNENINKLFNFKDNECAPNYQIQRIEFCVSESKQKSKCPLS